MSRILKKMMKDFKIKIRGCSIVLKREMRELCEEVELTRFPRLTAEFPALSAFDNCFSSSSSKMTKEKKKKPKKTQ
jgi:hypothetical protein